MAIIFSLVVLVAATSAVAAPGDLDSSFDLDGRVTTDLGSPDEEGYAVAIQPDGKILVLARTEDTDTFVTTFFLLRYDTAGALDTTFDGDGKLVITGPVSDVAVQGDGKIVLGGSVRVDLGDSVSSDFGVARLNSDGTPDMTFSDDGLERRWLAAAPHRPVPAPDPGRARRMRGHTPAKDISCAASYEVLSKDIS